MQIVAFLSGAWKCISKNLNCQSRILGGPAHATVTKTVHKTLPGQEGGGYPPSGYRLGQHYLM